MQIFVKLQIIALLIVKDQYHIDLIEIENYMYW